MTDRTINWVFKATDKTSQAFRSIDSKLAGITKSLRTFAGFAGFAGVAAGVGSLTKELITLGGQLQDASDKLGVNAETLQVLKFAAEQTGGSFDGLQAALAFNTKLVGEASRGNKEAAETFRLLGIDAKKFADLPIDRRLAVIAEQLKNVEDPALRLDLTLKALGRGGADLAPLLAQGAAGLAAFERQLRSTNSILSEGQVQALDDAGDAWEAFILRLKAQAAPVLTSTIGLLEKMAAAAKDSANLTGLIFGDETERMLRSAQGRDRGPSSRPRGRTSGLSQVEEATRVAEAGTGLSNEQIAAAEKAAAAALRAQKLLAAEAAKVDAEVRKVTDSIAGLSKEAAGYFNDRGKELSERYRAPLEVLQENIKEVNDLFLAGAISSDVANRAVQDYADTYARSLDVVKDKNVEVKDSTNEMFEQLKIAANGFARDLTDVFFDSTNSIGDMFEKLAETIAKALFTQGVTEPLINSILGSLGGSLFGGARASGGPVAGGRSYLVGERGPELFVPGASGKIVPNGEAGGTNINLTMNISSVDPQTAAQTIAGNERLVTGMIRRAFVRAGRRPQLA